MGKSVGSVYLLAKIGLISDNQKKYGTYLAIDAIKNAIKKR